MFHWVLNAPLKRYKPFYKEMPFRVRDARLKYVEMLLSPISRSAPGAKGGRIIKIFTNRCSKIFL